MAEENQLPVGEIPKEITDTLKSFMGSVKITKSINPVAYEIRFRPLGALNDYVFGLGDTVQEPEEVEFMQTFKMAGAPLDFVVMNTAQQEIMDALKILCTGTDYRYVLQKLKSVPR